MKIAIGNDHTAIEMKEIIKEFVEGKGYEVIDLGTNSTESCDYPVYGEKVGRAVAGGEADLGIAICGTGVGISLAANKVKGIRACVCSEPYFQDAQQFQRAGFWRQGGGKRACQDDYRGMAGR